MGQKLLYVTSFSEDLYKASGKRLLDSFIEHKIDAPILVCYEDFSFTPTYDNKNKNIYTYPLHTSEFLKTWLEDNKSVIPKYLGGTATFEKNPNIFKKVMKRKASRFFRKVASLHYAVNEFGDRFNSIVWIDCDCYFVKHLPTRKVTGFFNNAGMFYHHGKTREQNDAGFEAGFMGFSINNGGYELLEKIFETYSDKTYLNYRRWDDGYVIKKIVQANPLLPAIDLTPDASTNNPIMYDSPFRNYIKHEKGKHQRANISV